MTSDGLADRTLSSHRGKENVVLLFVPGAFTPPCTQELREMTSDREHYAGHETVIYGVSIDSPWAQDAWKNANELKFDLLSDYRHEVIQSYDVELENFADLGPSSKRATYLIDKSGAVRYVEVTAKPGDSPDFTALKKAVESL